MGVLHIPGAAAESNVLLLGFQQPYGPFIQCLERFFRLLRHCGAVLPDGKNLGIPVCKCTDPRQVKTAGIVHQRPGIRDFRQGICMAVKIIHP